MAVPYVLGGRSLDGWDCYGLYHYVMLKHHGVDVGSYSDEYPHTEGEPSSTAIVAALGRYVPRWARIEPGHERQGDGIVFRVLGRPMHCGYVMTPGTMLHALKGRGTCVERYDSAAWNKRIEGIYRWN